MLKAIFPVLFLLFSQNTFSQDGTPGVICTQGESPRLVVTQGFDLEPIIVDFDELEIDDVQASLNVPSGIRWGENRSLDAALLSPCEGDPVEIVERIEGCAEGNFDCTKIKVTVDTLVWWMFSAFGCDPDHDPSKDQGPKIELFIYSGYVCES